MKQFVAQFDSSMIHLVRVLPQSIRPLMYGLSFIGRPIFTIGLLGVIGLTAVLSQQIDLVIAVFVAAATFGINSILKILVHRPRPDAYQAESVILPTYSFPSGHAASAVVIFGLLAFILLHILPQFWNIIAVVVLKGIIIGIGISRVYIGAHYPSDVVVGWIIGFIGLAVIIWGIQPL